MNLGNLAAGPHSFKISVPTAVFVDAQGYFPVSVYLQGENTVLGIDNIDVVSYDISPNPAMDFVSIKCNTLIKSLQLFDVQGKQIEGKIVNEANSKIDISHHPKGIYFLKIETENGQFTEKIIKE